MNTPDMRTHFAAAALTALITTNDNTPTEELAHQAWNIADTMLSTRQTANSSGFEATPAGVKADDLISTDQGSGVDVMTMFDRFRRFFEADSSNADVAQRIRLALCQTFNVPINGGHAQVLFDAFAEATKNGLSDFQAFVAVLDARADVKDAVRFVSGAEAGR